MSEPDGRSKEGAEEGSEKGVLARDPEGDKTSAWRLPSSSFESSGSSSESESEPLVSTVDSRAHVRSEELT